MQAARQIAEEIRRELGDERLADHHDVLAAIDRACGPSTTAKVRVAIELELMRLRERSRAAA